MIKLSDNSNKIALIIGMDNYKSSSLEDLPSCKKDAEDLYKLLSHLNYTFFGKEPIIGSNLNEENGWVKVHRTIKDFFNTAEPGQTLFFYFSGHGIPREGEIYLALPGVDPKDPIVEGYSLSNLTRLMNSTKSMKVVSIIDACYSGAATLPTSSMKEKKAKEIAGYALATYDRLLDNIPKSEGRYFLLSSQAYQSSLAIPKSNSLYTKYLIEGLNGTESTTDEKGRKIPASVDDYGNVTPETLHRYVYHKVANEAKQVPKMKSDKASDIILAEYPEMIIKPVQENPTSSTSTDITYIIDEGLQFLKTGDYEKAIESFDKAISTNPNSYVAYNYKGDILFTLKNYEEAIKCYDEALRLEPKYIDVLKDKGLALFNLSRYEEAIQCFDKALKLNSKISQNWYYKGLMFSKLVEFEEAIKYYDEALILNPKNVEALIGKGNGLFELNKYAEAINCYNLVLSIEPTNMMAKDKKDTALGIIADSIDYSFIREWGSSGEIPYDDDESIIDKKMRTILKKSGVFNRNGDDEDEDDEVDLELDGKFHNPEGIAIDSRGYVYVVDTDNHRIQKFDSNGRFITKWGSKGDYEDSYGYGSDSRLTRFKKWSSKTFRGGKFNEPTGIAVDCKTGNVYVVDTENDRIQKFNSNGNFITKWGSQGRGSGQFDDPRGIAVDSEGNVYVADTHNHRIQKFDSNGNFITKWGSNGKGDGQFNFPEDIAVDSEGNVYVVEGAYQRNNRIQKFDSNGRFITKWGSEGKESGQFNDPRWIAIDSRGYVYVVDSDNSRIQKFDSNGRFITKWGSEGKESGQFNDPRGIAVDASGNVYVVDKYNDRIQVFALK